LITNDIPPPAALVDLLRSVAGLGRALFDSAACSVALLDDDESTLTYVAAVGIGSAQIVGVHLPVNRGIAGWVASSGQPIGIADVSSDNRFDRAVAESTGYIPHAILAVPIESSRGDTLGVIQVLDPVTAPDRDDMSTLGMLSSHAELCIEAATLQRPGSPGSGSGELERLISELRDLRPSDQQTAGQLLGTFIAHTRR
jgi:signal transduction protein with GAF and PtsI domain